MPDNIDPKRFSGHRGYVAEDTNKDGKLGPEDKVHKLTKDDGVKGRVDAGDRLSPEPVAWDDPAFAEARRDFVDKSEKASELLKATGAVNMELEKSRSGVGPKPPESRVTSIADQAKRLRDSDASPAIRAQAELALAGAMGIIAGQYRTGKLGRMGPGKEAYKALKAATVTDPDSPDTWKAFASTCLSVQTVAAKLGGTARFFMKLVGMNAADDASRCVTGLSRFPNDPSLQVYMRHMLVALGDERTPAQNRELEQVETRLTTLRQAHPAQVAETEQAIARLLQSVSDNVGKENDG